MYVTAEELARFSGVIKEDDETQEKLQSIYIGSAQKIIDDYLGYDIEAKYTEQEEDVPALVCLVCLEIATLIQLEENSNIGVNSSSDFGSNRNFLNVVNYDRYLDRLSAYRNC